MANKLFKESEAAEATMQLSPPAHAFVQWSTATAIKNQQIQRIAKMMMVQTR